MNASAPDCTTCNDLGTVDCDYCEGSGMDEDGELCDSCEGEGQVDCQDCV